jgi:hypothetical protein
MPYPAPYYSLRIVQNDLSLDMTTHDANLAQRQLSQWLNALLGDTWLQGNFAGNTLAVAPQADSHAPNSLASGPLPATVHVPEALPVALHQPTVAQAVVLPQPVVQADPAPEEAVVAPAPANSSIVVQPVALPPATTETEAVVLLPLEEEAAVAPSSPALEDEVAPPEEASAEPDEFEAVLGTLMDDDVPSTVAQAPPVTSEVLETSADDLLPQPAPANALPKRLFTRTTSKLSSTDKAKSPDKDDTLSVKTIAIDVAPDPFKALDAVGKADASLVTEDQPATTPAVISKTLGDLCAEAKPSTPEAYLLLASYYLTFFEQITAFSLKRINTLMAASGLMPLNHSVLEQALGKDYLVMVPDFTGEGTSIEYQLTEAGQLKARTML